MSALRQHLDALKAKHDSTGKSLNYATPNRGGGLSRSGAAIFPNPVQIGKELGWVKEPLRVCLGRIGTTGVKCCLKTIGDCETESHERTKCEFPEGVPFLIQLHSPLRGHSNTVLESADLELALVEELLETEGLNWAREFELMRAQGTRTLADSEEVSLLLRTARKGKAVSAPSDDPAISKFAESYSRLDDVQTVVSAMSIVRFDSEGAKVLPQEFTFESEAYGRLCGDVYEKIELLSEHAKCVTNCIQTFPVFRKEVLGPVTDLCNGLKLEIASLRGDLGPKDLSKTDVPPGLWNAIETGFDSIQTLELKKQEDTKEAVKVAVRIKDCEDTADYLLTLLDSKDEEQLNSRKKEPLDDEGKDYVLRTFQPQANKEKPKQGEQQVGFHNRNGGCDENVARCSLCMTRMTSIESKVTGALVRLSNLEDTKTGTIESALMIKSFVFRNRSDVTAWCATQFPEDSVRKTVECGCFMTPHYLLNLVHADMCNKPYPTIELSVKDMKSLGVNRPNSTAYSAIQASKPDFMKTTSQCPNHVQKASKSVREAAPLKFIPSFEDFGSSSDSETLHYRFKESLSHVKGAQEKYIETRLEDHPNSKVWDVAKQMLEDSAKFVNQMLDFMEELYKACHDSFGATTGAWDLVCHCLEKLFTEEFKPSLKHSVEQDLVDARSAFIGAIHTAFSLNVKVRELTTVGLKNHHSTTTSHVRFVMKMASNSRKGDDNNASLQSKYDALVKKNETQDKLNKSLESRIDKLLNSMNKQLSMNNKPKVSFD
jgi:hypothetical protein